MIWLMRSRSCRLHLSVQLRIVWADGSDHPLLLKDRVGSLEHAADICRSSFGRAESHIKEKTLESSDSILRGQTEKHLRGKSAFGSLSPMGLSSSDPCFASASASASASVFFGLHAMLVSMLLLNCLARGVSTFFFFACCRKFVVFFLFTCPFASLSITMCRYFLCRCLPLLRFPLA